MTCPCGSNKESDDCCSQYIRGIKYAPTAEALMRSRYTAYTTHNIGYIFSTIALSERDNFDKEATAHWAKNSKWLDLEVLATKAGGPSDTRGTVEFIAHYETNGNVNKHHEIGSFIKEHGEWFYKDGKILGPDQVINLGPKVGRNDPCNCGSGKKYKRCCGIKTREMSDQS